MVLVTPAVQQRDVWDALGGVSIPSFKFSEEQPVGSGIYVPKNPMASYTGTIKEEPFLQQATDYTTGELKVYADSGQPIMDVVLTFDTDYRDPSVDDDDGTRRLYMNGAQKAALQQEMRAKGLKKFGIGTKMTVTHVGFGVNKGQGRAPYKYEITIHEATEYVAPQAAAVNQALAQGGYQEVQGGFPGQVAPIAQQAAPVQAAPVQAAPVQAAPVAPAPVAPAPVAAAPVAEAVSPVLTQTHVDEVNLMISAGVPRATAMAATTQTAGGNAAFAAALESNIPF